MSHQETSSTDASSVVRRMRTQFRTDARRQNARGATVIEYALIAGLIAVVVVASVTLVGERTQTSLENTASEVSAAITP